MAQKKFETKRDRKNLAILILASLLLVLVAGGAGAFLTTQMDNKPGQKTERKITWNAPVAAPAAVAQAEPCDDGNIVGHAVGGVVGGIAGSQVGSGSGKTAATIGGTLGGAALGGYLPTRNVTCR